MHYCEQMAKSWPPHRPPNSWRPAYLLWKSRRRLGHSKTSHTLDLYGHAHAILRHDEVAKQIGTTYNLNSNEQPKKIRRLTGKKIRKAGS